MSEARTLETWVARFKRDIVPPDAGEEVVRAFLHHLADLGVFQTGGGARWSLAGTDPEDILNHLEKLCATEKGFAVGYFLASRSGLAEPGDFKLAAGPAHRESGFNFKRSADPSNLQIVRKTAAGLQPFLDLEKNWLDKLAGPNTSRGDARKLFNYMLSRTRVKAQPLKWQQLSRRRHRKSLPD
ncbi:MAG: hypothetical protein ACE5G9_08370 [Nitrospinales bacterium]